MYPDYFQNWLHFGHSLLNFLNLVPLWLTEMGEIGYFWAFLRADFECNSLKVGTLTTFRSDYNYVSNMSFNLDFLAFNMKINS